ncbi:MAG: terpene cyclase/mutase family protein, partial [Intrasporangiaceae bacterium]|nr:terpene cyclase/mutase family protein [Intrasporangiaceae bacterium]
AAKIAGSIDGYIGTDGETYAGATAKSLILALALGLNPTDFGGVDLLATLDSLEQGSGADAGRFSDRSEYGDYSNILVQSFAVLGLEGAGVGASQAAVDYLISAQCDDGGFALNTGGATCVSDPDATALAVQALLVSPCATDASVTAAIDYLVGRQAGNGGFGGGATTEGVNANSTGLIGATLATAGLDESAAAAEYLLTMQYGSGFPEALRGGFAYDAKALAERAAAGADAAVVDQDRRTTVQAVLGLTGTSYADLVGALANAPERTCSVHVEPPAPPAPGPIVETDIVATGNDVAPFALLATLLLLAGGGVVVATRERGAQQ